MVDVPLAYASLIESFIQSSSATNAGAPVPQGRLEVARDEVLGRESKTERSRRDG